MVVANLWEKHVDKLVNKILDILGTKKYGKLMVAKVTYALQVLIGEMEKLILLSIFFGLMGNLNDFIIAFSTLALLRPFTGGMHRTTMLGCFLHTICAFCAIIFLGKNIVISNEVFTFVTLLLMCLIIRFVPIQSANRIRYNSKQRLRFKVKSLIAVGMIVVVCLYVPLRYCNVMMFVVIVHTSELAFLCLQLYRKEKKSNERKFEKGT